ncbi:Chaperone protein HtpG [Candidatus Kinetoplastibacterium sorsogonicusi]|uniref:Chaperone protein HtpG n=1 Tax=Candidatus Kinetoplastidibacterium kentomonadis TaxID=1576550 RepID=A0A3Q8ETW8_9PROT|nr:molecular chaperone HtpG [Candidatus Kinetoplastibacterium sorsogonicusi]AWD32222.1 Chaperone protein HtpG [Candidatus Kinetoplastibacterium sorsogonicusi]
MTKNNNLAKETISFQTEVKQLLHLMIHSLYSNKEIFLRELISNASDACDKLRFESIENSSLLNNKDLSIIITYSKEKGTITISDNGIGLNREEAIENLGTIARSGTKDFFSKLTGDKQKDSNLIGQFGVGFYSAFIVADQVSVISRKFNVEENQAICWESNGEGEFSINYTNKKSSGTDVILHLKADENEFLNGWKIRDIVRRFSNHISLPIKMFKEEWNEEKKEQIITDQLEIINIANALWARNKTDITNEQYIDFYKTTFNDFNDPLAWTHNHVEGNHEYTQLLFIPKKSQFDLWERDHKSNLKLYVKKVFIMDDSDQLLPNFLRFVKGIIDASDLPLNISREILQESRYIKIIKDSSTKRVISLLEDIANNKHEDYLLFWNEFGQILKEGIGEDFNNKLRLSKLLRFASTNSQDNSQKVSLIDYVSRMKENQNDIYYITADSYEAAINSPHIEIFRKKNIEVLLLSDRIDEWMLSYLQDFQEKKLISIAKSDLDLSNFIDEKDKVEQKELIDSSKEFIKNIKEVLSDKVKDVLVSNRLVDSPACIVVGKNDLSPHMIQILKNAGQNPNFTKPILEVNPKHPILEYMKTLGDNEFKEMANIIFDQSLLLAGGQLPDFSEFIKNINHFIVK